MLLFPKGGRNSHATLIAPSEVANNPGPRPPYQAVRARAGKKKRNGVSSPKAFRQKTRSIRAAAQVRMATPKVETADFRYNSTLFTFPTKAGQKPTYSLSVSNPTSSRFQRILFSPVKQCPRILLHNDLRYGQHPSNCFRQIPEGKYYGWDDRSRRTPFREHT